MEQKQTLLPLRSGSEETVDTVVAVSSAKKQENREAENRWERNSKKQKTGEGEHSNPRAEFKADVKTRQRCRLNICSYIGWMTNTVFVNSTNITTNVETAALSTQI